MNLYKIEFTHYAPKDSKSGIKGYMVAENDEEVYEFIKSEPEIHDKTLYNSYKDYEDEEKDFKERIIECHGDMYDEESEVYDLYYGATQYGWELVYENIIYDDIETLRELQILVN